jgi:hypothetical protein
LSRVSKVVRKGDAIERCTVPYVGFIMFQVKEFYNTNKGKFSFAERKMEQEMEELQLRVDWHNSNYNTTAFWLQKYHDE